MKKKLIILLTCVMLNPILTGCSSENEITQKDKPKMTPVNTNYLTDYYYTIDERTGIVYIEFDGYNRHGITVAYNEDGSVMRREDLEKNDES